MTTKTEVIEAIEQSKFTQALKDMGVPYTEQSGFIRVEGPKGRRMYVAKTKGVRRVDLSGFTIDVGAVSPSGGEFGRVKQQLDFSGGEAATLQLFIKTVKHMMSLPPSETARRLRDEEPALPVPPVPSKQNGHGKKKKAGKKVSATPPTLRPRPSA